MVDSCSTQTNVQKSLANSIIKSDGMSCCLHILTTSGLKTRPNEKLETISVINKTIKCSDCAANDVKMTVAEDDHRTVIGRLLLSSSAYLYTNQNTKYDRSKPLPYKTFETP